MPLLRAHAQGTVSGHAGSLQEHGPVRVQGRSAYRHAPLGDARGRGRQLPGGAKRRRLLDLCGLPAHPRAGDHRPGPRRAKSFAALDRIARQEATLGKLDETRLDACIAKQDETKVQESAKLADSLGIDGTPAVYVNGERVGGGAVAQDQLWMVIDRACAPRASSLRRQRLPCRRRQRRLRAQRLRAPNSA